MIKEGRLGKYMVPDKAFTHGGKFHSDDVFSAALLMYMNPDIVIERGFEVPEDYDGLVFDIGGGSFDHHQKDARKRENGNPYAAFGLLWERYGAQILGEDDARYLDEHMIEPMDLSDNTGCENAMAELISTFNPSWDSPRNKEDAFFEAVFFAKTILEKKFDQILGSQRAEVVVKKALEKAKRRVLILSEFAPWKKTVKGTDVLFVVFPSYRGGFCAQAVPDPEHENELILPFPESWRGAGKETLREVSGIHTLDFCHNSGFLLAGRRFDDIMQACYKTMELAGYEV